jgi:hypothetical protein
VDAVKGVSMFNVRVVKVVWTADERTVESWRTDLPPQSPRAAHLSFDLTLPFAPYPGMSLGSDSWDSGPLTKVRWDNDHRLFICLVAEIYAGDSDAFDSQVERDLRDGWIRLGGDAPGWVDAIVRSDDP